MVFIVHSMMKPYRFQRTKNSWNLRNTRKRSWNLERLDFGNSWHSQPFCVSIPPKHGELERDELLFCEPVDAVDQLARCCVSPSFRDDFFPHLSGEGCWIFYKASHVILAFVSSDDGSGQSDTFGSRDGHDDGSSSSPSGSKAISGDGSGSTNGSGSGDSSGSGHASDSGSSDSNNVKRPSKSC